MGRNPRQIRFCLHLFCGNRQNQEEQAEIPVVPLSRVILSVKLKEWHPPSKPLPPPISRDQDLRPRRLLRDRISKNCWKWSQKSSSRIVPAADVRAHSGYEFLQELVAGVLGLCG